MKKKPFREPARILFHLNDCAMVVLERTEGKGLADGGVWREIPTDYIPFHLRQIGSRFYLVGEYVTPEPSDSAEDVRAAINTFRIEE